MFYITQKHSESACSIHRPSEGARQPFRTNFMDFLSNTLKGKILFGVNNLKNREGLLVNIAVKQSLK